MNVRKKIEDKIRKQKEKIDEIRLNLMKEEAYLSGLQATVTLMPKENGRTELRAGTLVADARDYLRKVGKPLHVSKILEGIGKEVTRDSKVSMSGSIAAYVRKNQFFTRIAPNVFGLKEFEGKAAEISDVEVSDEEIPF